MCVIMFIMRCGRETVAIHIAHEVANSRNTHNSSNRNPRVTKQLGYKHIIFKNSVYKKMLLLIFS
jgi:hypothetical protein